MNLEEKQVLMSVEVGLRMLHAHVATFERNDEILPYLADLHEKIYGLVGGWPLMQNTWDQRFGVLGGQ